MCRLWSGEQQKPHSRKEFQSWSVKESDPKTLSRYVKVFGCLYSGLAIVLTYFLGLTAKSTWNLSQLLIATVSNNVLSFEGGQRSTTSQTPCTIPMKPESDSVVSPTSSEGKFQAGSSTELNEHLPQICIEFLVCQKGSWLSLDLLVLWASYRIASWNDHLLAVSGNCLNCVVVSCSQPWGGYLYYWHVDMWKAARLIIKLHGRSPASML